MEKLGQDGGDDLSALMGCAEDVIRSNLQGYRDRVSSMTAEVNTLLDVLSRSGERDCHDHSWVMSQVDNLVGAEVAKVSSSVGALGSLVSKLVELWQSKDLVDVGEKSDRGCSHCSAVSTDTGRRFGSPPVPALDIQLAQYRTTIDMVKKKLPKD